MAIPKPRRENVSALPRALILMTAGASIGQGHTA
jgi:hypothetical protein